MGKRTRIAVVLVVTLLVLPLLAVPLFLMGGGIAGGLDDNPRDGVFALGLILGIGGPGLLAILVARRAVNTPAAVVLGIASSLISVGVLFAALLIYCGATDCDL